MMMELGPETMRGKHLNGLKSENNHTVTLDSLQIMVLELKTKWEESVWLVFEIRENEDSVGQNNLSVMQMELV